MDNKNSSVKISYKHFTNRFGFVEILNCQQIFQITDEFVRQKYTFFCSGSIHSLWRFQNLSFHSHTYLETYLIFSMGCISKRQGMRSHKSTSIGLEDYINIWNLMFQSVLARSPYLNYRDLNIGVNNKNGYTSYNQASIWGL